MMNRLFGFVLLVAGLGLGLGLGLGGGAGRDSPEAVLARVRARQAKLATLRAALVQTKSYPQLGIDDPPESGRFLLQRGRAGTRARIEIEAPEKRVLVVNDGRYVLYQPRIRQAIEGKLGGAASGAKGILAGILTLSPEAMDELEKSYVLSGLGVERLGELGVHHLRFVARDDVPVYCQAIELFVDVSLDLPVRQTCREANRAVVTFTLSAIEIDVPLDDRLFELDLPAGVERVRGRS
jgi:outer membrane lipoprotein-sorting protein